MSKFTLTAARRGVTSVSVDDQTLFLDGDPVELTDDQAERVSAIAGVELAEAESDGDKPKGKSSSASTTGGSSASTAKD